MRFIRGGEEGGEERRGEGHGCVGRWRKKKIIKLSEIQQYFHDMCKSKSFKTDVDT